MKQKLHFLIMMLSYFKTAFAVYHNYTGRGLMKFTAKASFFLVIIFLATPAFAVPIKSGTYNVTAASSNNVQLTDLSFITVNSIGSAVSALNTYGVESLGTVEFDFADGYSETATSQYDIGSAGSALFSFPYTAVIFKHNGVGANPVLMASTTGANSASDYILRLNGADNITWDGIDLVENPANTMTASTTAATTVAPMEYGLHVRNSGANPAQNNTFKNFRIILYNFLNSSSTKSSVNTYGIYQLSDVAGAKNSGNVYDNIQVDRAYRGVVINGMPGNEDVGCVIKNCTIGKDTTGAIGGASTTYGGTADAMGVRLISQQDFTFFNNTVQQVQYARTGSSGIAYGVFVSLTTGSNTIRNNKIYKIVSQRTGSATGSPCTGLEIQATSGTYDVYNNMIGSIQSSASATTTFMLFGIRIQGSGTMNLYHNSINLPNISGSGQCSSVALCVANGSNTGSSAFTGTITVIDNIISNSVVIASGSAKAYAFHFGGGTLASSNYNILDIIASGARYTGSYGGTDRQTLAAWQAVAGDANSKQFVVPFLSNSDLHLNLAAPNVNYLGTFISSPSITTDIDGEVRSYPFIGADEKIFTIDPQVFISGNHPSDSLVALNTTNNLLAGIALNVSGVANTLTGITFTTAGVYTTGPIIDFSNVTLWYSSSPTFSAATSTVLNNTTYATTMPALGANNLSFTGLSLNLPLGATYLYVTFNVPLNAVAGHNVRVTSTPFTNITFGNASTTKVGIDPVPQGGLQTIAQYYYNYPNSDFTLEPSWYENVTGTFQNPTNFTDPNQVFVFIANTGSTMSQTSGLPSWNVSGTNTRIDVGDGINPVVVEAKLPIVTGAGVVLNVKNKGHIKFQSSYIPTTLGTLGQGTAAIDGSTVEYGDTTVTVTIDTVISANYCNLILSGTTTGLAKRNFFSNVGVSRVFTTGGFPGATLGTITFNGTLVTQTIPSGFIYRGLRTNNSFGTTILGGNVQVDSLLRFTTSLNVTAGQTLTLGSNAVVFAPAAGLGTLTITGANATLTNTNPLTTTFLGTAASLNPYIVFGPGSFYNLSATLSSTANNYGQIPPATWDATSTINITNVTSAGANSIVIGQPASYLFGNITFSAPGLSADYRLFGGINNTNAPGAGTVATPWLLTMQGNLTLGVTNGFTVDIGAGTATQSCSTFVYQNFVQSSGIYRLQNTTGSTGKVIYAVTNDITLSSAAQLLLSGTNPNNINVQGIINVGGNFTANSGTTVTELATLGTNSIVFTKAGTQVLTTTGANFNNDINYIVNNGSITQLGTSSNLTVNTGAYINLLNGGVFDIAAGNTLTINGLLNTGSTTGTFSGTATSNLLIGGTATGSVGTAYFTSGSAVLNNFSIDRGVAAAPSVTVGGTTGLTVHGTITIGSSTNTNNTIDMGTNALIAGGSFASNISATGTLRTANTTATPIPVNKTWGGTVRYYSASPQTMVSGNFNILDGTSGNRTLSSTGTIGIAGTGNCFITGAGVYTIDNSTVDFNGAGAQNIPAFTFENLVSSNGSSTKTLVGNVDIRESITLSNTTTTQLANFSLTLLSTATKTARLNPVTTAASIAYGGTGLAFPQRYFSALRSWRLITAPINATGTHYISEAWQELGSTAGVNGRDYSTPAATAASTALDPAGFVGTQITGGTIGNGFDQGQLNNPSIKYFNAGSWPGPANTNNTTVNSKEGWMLFVRGDRKNYGQITNQYKAPVATTLRPRGQLFIGSKTITGAAAGFQVVGNPYPASIDFHKLYTSNPKTGSWPANASYYIWDPHLGSQGAFVALTWDATPGADSFQRATPFATGYYNYDDSRYIASGSAIIVSFPSAGSTFGITEVDKVANNTSNYFRPIPGISKGRLQTVLSSVSVSETKVTDGALILFDNNAENGVDVEDMLKMGNFKENIVIATGNKLLALERRKQVSENDTIFYGLYRMEQKRYQLKVIMNNMDVPSSLSAFLEDTYLKIKTPVSIQGESMVDFDVTADAGSYATGRFRLIFRRSAVFTGIKAFVEDKNVAVEWKLAGEFNIKHYEIERSLDGINFSKIGTSASKGNNDKPVEYKWLDVQPEPAEYYYRIKSVSNDGITVYSNIEKVKIVKRSPEIYVFPNPVTNNNIQLQLNSAAPGKYTTRLFTNGGQLIETEVVLHAGGTATKVIVPSTLLVGGNYQLEVTGPGKKVSIITVFVNKD